MTGKLNTLSGALIAWAGIVTVALFVIIGVVYRKLRSKYIADNSSSSAMSIVSDAESGSTAGSSFDYDRRSIVDVDLAGVHDHDLDLDDQVDTFDSMPAQSAATAVPIDVHRLDSELNEETLQHIAALQDDDGVPSDATDVQKDHLTTARHKFRHAPFKGLHMNDGAAGGASFL